MAQHDDHLRILSIFHYVVGGVTALFACIPIIHLVVGIILVVAGLSAEEGGPPAFIGVLFIVVALLFIVCGWALAACLVYAGH